MRLKCLIVFVALLIAAPSFAQTRSSFKELCQSDAVMSLGESMLNAADRAAVDLSLQYDALVGTSILLSIDDDDRGTCSAPKLTGGCLKCADKATCKTCCVDHFGSDSTGGSDKKKAGCLKGCESKWPNGSTCN